MHTTLECIGTRVIVHIKVVVLIYRVVTAFGASLGFNCINFVIRRAQPFVAIRICGLIGVAAASKRHHLTIGRDFGGSCRNRSKQRKCEDKRHENTENLFHDISFLRNSVCYRTNNKHQA